MDLSLIRDFGGLAVGLVLLLVAVSVLPGRVKWYVLTAGLAILGWETYTRLRNREEIKKLDAERKKLQERADALSARGVELERRLAGLDAELSELRKRRDAVNKTDEELSRRGGDLAALKSERDAAVASLDAEAEAILAQREARRKFLAEYQQMQQAVEAYKNANPEPRVRELP